MADPQSPAPSQVPAVQVATDLKSFAQPSGAAAQVPLSVRAAATFHQMQPGQWFDGPDQDSRCDASGFRHHVEALPRMDGVYVGSTGMAEHAGIFSVDAVERMGRRIVGGQIGFGFDDAAGSQAFARAAVEDFSEQSAGDISNVVIVEGQINRLVVHVGKSLVARRHQPGLSHICAGVRGRLRLPGGNS